MSNLYLLWHPPWRRNMYISFFSRDHQLTVRFHSQSSLYCCALYFIFKYHFCIRVAACHALKRPYVCCLSIRSKQTGNRKHTITPQFQKTSCIISPYFPAGRRSNLCKAGLYIMYTSYYTLI